MAGAARAGPIARLIGVCLALCLMPLLAAAQSVTEIEFPPGDYGKMISGSITGRAYADYQLRANEGQELFAELMVPTGNGISYFNILPPGSDDVAIFIGSTEGETARIILPDDGVYTIRVYQMGAARDEGQTTAFNIDLSIQ